MQSSHLNGDYTNKFYAIGIEGIPFWQCAETFKDSLERTASLGKDASYFFAIPKFNHDNSYVDWYIPFEPQNSDGEYRVIPYSQCSEDEREFILNQIKSLESKFFKVASNIKNRSLVGDDALFAKLLLGVNDTDRYPSLSFPSKDYIFIIDGKVVITFWGFKQFENTSYKSLMQGLKEPKASAPSQNLNSNVKESTPPLNNALAQETNTTNTTNTTTTNTTTTSTEEVVTNRHVCALPLCLRWLLALLLLLLLLLLLYFLFPNLFPKIGLPFGNSAYPESSLVDNQNKDKPKDEALKEDPSKNAQDNLQDEKYNTDKLALDGVNVSNVAPSATNAGVGNSNGSSLGADAGAPSSNLADGQNKDGNMPSNLDNPNIAPVDLANGDNKVDSANGTNSNNTNNKNVTPPEIAANNATQENGNKNNLGQDSKNIASENVKPLDANKLKNNDLSVIDGHWGTRSGIMDANTGKPLNMEYNLKDGKGEVIIKRLDGSKCVSKAESTINNGVLEIKSLSDAKCPDNKTYTVPVVKCNVDGNNKARCNGNYEGKEDFPLNMFSK